MVKLFFDETAIFHVDDAIGKVEDARIMGDNDESFIGINREAIGKKKNQLFAKNIRCLKRHH